MHRPLVLLVVHWIIVGNVWCLGTTIGFGQNLVTFSNSPALTEVLNLNDAGLVLGRREVAVSNMLSMEVYVRVGQTDQPVPIPESFTHVEVSAIDGNDQLVGFATRPAGDPRGNQRTFVHTLTTGQSELLPLPPEFRGSCAFDISQDGASVSGYVVGRDPPRLQPCVWNRQHDAWTVTLLPVVNPFNPLLTTAHVKISDDGRSIAASLVDRVTSDGVRRYGLYLWSRRDVGSWDSRRLVDRAVHLGDLNNEGMVAGRVLEGNRHRAFVYDPRRGALVLPLPEGRDSAYATDVNSRGQVVGVLEDPPGPDGTMSAFLWNQGELRLPAFGTNTVASTANVITDDGRVGGLLVRGDLPADQQKVESYILQVPAD